jgi:hypothetical protein
MILEEYPTEAPSEVVITADSVGLIPFPSSLAGMMGFSWNDYLACEGVDWTHDDD